ncbi:hypothetical protein [Pontivivens insulae]|uniref:hypothetical protein n=1 Tax=Pontivivens insulae TaxID=1639689 RepID=UPI0011B1E7B2|nr:hypothetical protein [Pontivivens insulae]
MLTLSAGNMAADVSVKTGRYNEAGNPSAPRAVKAIYIERAATAFWLALGGALPFAMFTIYHQLKHTDAMLARIGAIRCADQCRRPCYGCEPRRIRSKKNRQRFHCL